MKTIFKLFAILAGASLILGSCNEKLLDIPQQGVQSEDNSYITDDDCLAATTAIYHAWRAVWSGCGYTIGPCYVNMFWMLNCMADDMTDSSANQAEFAYSTVTPANSWIEANYNGLYRCIYFSNIVLDKFQPESAVKSRCIAEAKFFRALCYYELITLWGAVPKVDHILSPEEYNIGKTEISELWQFVETDLNEAIESGKLPSKTGIDDKETGTRITKEAALAVLGKVYLTEEKFTEAKTTLDKVINSGLYGLIPDMNDLYHMQANGCREYIFENVRKWDTANLRNPDPQASAVQDGWYGLQDNWPFPYCFETDGTQTFPFVDQMGWGGMNPTRKVYDAFVAEEGPSSYRRLASCLVLEDLPSFGVKFTNGASWKGNEGVFRFKWLMSLEDEMWNAWTGNLTNTPCMRYADVLLLAAEAAVRGGGGSADAYVNEVRARAKLPAKSGVTLEDVKKERLLELCFEAVRFQDLKRWGDLAKECADKGKKMPTLMASGTVQYVDNPDPSAGFQERDLLLPFPLSEIQTNKALADQQNPGY